MAPSALKSSLWSGGDLDLWLANTLEALAASRGDLDRFCQVHGLDSRVCARLEVIFEEVVSNAIRHGFAAGSDQSVKVRLRAGEREIELTFEDDGRPFNPLDQPAPPPFRSLETATPGGLGIPLVRSLSASVSYERVAEAAPGERDAFRPSNRLVVAVARS